MALRMPPTSTAATANVGVSKVAKPSRKPPAMRVVTKGWWTLKERRAGTEEVERCNGERAKASA